jgi:hypothetical protein
MTEISDEQRWYLLFRRRTEIEVKGIFEAYREMSVEPVLIKGWAAARNYPEDHPRFYGDIDIAVPANQAEKCLNLNLSQRFASLEIDLHRELRHLDTTSWDELISRSQLIDIDGTAIRVLCPEDHLRVLCVHWLTDGGQYKDRLWDIYYAIDNRPADFDWELFLNGVSEKRRNWLMTAIAITRKHLSLDTSGLPFSKDVEHYPRWIDNCLAKEWASDVRIRALDTLMGEPKMFWRQLRKRIPPNPIEATIEAGALFDDRSRLPSQVKSMALRAKPSLVRIVKEANRRIWTRRAR